MTSPLLLTALFPTTGVDPLPGDVLPPFGVAPVSQTSSSEPSVHRTRTVGGANHAHTALVPPARQWSGMPIRAIVPLPRRKLGLVASGAQGTAPSRPGGGDVHSDALPGTVPCSKRSTQGWPDADSCTAEIEDGDGEGEGEGNDEDADDGVAPSGCSYESITAAEGLSAWSFEELRVECYAQSLVARGTKPPPVFQPALAIPPAFVPRSVARN